MGRSYRPTAYLGFGRVYFNIAASDAPEPLRLFTECAVGSFDMSERSKAGFLIFDLRQRRLWSLS
jgi:hypothetical protein